nr:PHD finger protein MALE MEIOCYTE DEATH 1 [Ipomoea trifida]
MSPPILEAFKKRKKTPKFFGLHSFAEAGYPIFPTGPFVENIRFFLQECADLEDYEVERMPIWITFLVHESRGFAAPLYTIEETVNRSSHQVCNHCRYAGWSQHLVSKRKYHFIIPIDDEWNQPLTEGVLDLQTHLLHGMIHCNGFGHLLCVNGIEGGSKFLCGREIMDLWDRICTNLQARNISVEDLSKKHSMDLRLLYGVAYGHSWFGRWGYRFGRGCFGVMEHDYERAIQILSSLELDHVVDDFNLSRNGVEIRQIILSYRNLSQTQLFTLRDLFKFMLSLKSKGPALPTVRPCSSKRLIRTTIPSKPLGKDRSARCRKFVNLAACMDSRWPLRRLEFTANVIVDALKEKKQENKSGSYGMTRQEVRDAARVHIGDTGLIDHVLKSMNNVIVGSYVVHRAVNRATRVLEYTLQELKNRDQTDQERVLVPEPDKPASLTAVPPVDVFGDVYCLYSNVLLGYKESDVVSLAAQTILDTKHFVKEWPFRDELDDLLRFICIVVPSSIDMETVLPKGIIPKEHIVVPLHSTIGDLKLAIEAAMRDTYCAMEEFVVTDIKGLEGVGDDEVIFGIVESGTELCTKGLGLAFGGDLKFEDRAHNWTVKCKCGARDDDGERMISCDVCEIWQHTRCVGIKDDKAVPPLFVCEVCCGRLAPTRTLGGFELGCHETALIPWQVEADTALYF